MSEQFRPIFDEDDEQPASGATDAVEAAQDTDESSDVPKLMPADVGWEENVSKGRVLIFAAVVVAILTGAVVGVRAAIDATSSTAPRPQQMQRAPQRAEPPSSLRGLGDALERDEAARSAASRDDDPYANVDPAVGATTALPLEFDGPVPSANSDSDDVVTDEEMARYKAEHRAHLQGNSGDPSASTQGSQNAAKSAKAALPPMEVWGADWSPSGHSKASAQSPAPTSFPSEGGLPGMGAGAHPSEDGASARLETPDDVKEAFAARTAALDSNSVERALGECEVTAGDAIAVGNVDAINTDIPARAAVLVEVVQDVYCGANHEHIAIPAGSKFTASANARVSYGDARIQLCMDQLKRPPSRGFPTGSLVPITGCWAAAEIDGTTGWAAEVDNHWDTIVGAATLSAVLSLSSGAAAGNQTGFAPTLAQNAAANVGQQINQAGNRIVMRELGVKPTLTREMLQTARVKVTTNQPLSPWVPVHGITKRRR